MSKSAALRSVAVDACPGAHAAVPVASPRRAAAGAVRPGPDVVVDGVRLAYDDAGEGVPIVCLHAIGHGARDFAPLRERLGPGWRVIALDWPGQGASAPDRVPADAGRYADLFAGFIDALGLDRFVLLGNSIGGAAAIRYAAAHPGRVRALVLENVGALDRGGDRIAPLVIGLMTRFFAAGARGARWFPAAFGAYYRTVLPLAPARAQRDRIVASAREIAPVLRDAWESFGRPEADIRALVPGIDVPVFTAWGTGDRVAQLARCRPALARFPRHTLATFACGHAAHLECPDELAAALSGFLRDTGIAPE